MIGRIVALAAGMAAALAVAAPSATAQELAEFSYGNDSIVPPWQAIQTPAGRMTVQGPSPEPTRKVLRVELRNGDVWAGANRAEVYGRFGNTGDYSAWPDGDNTERWYGWSTYFEPGFPAVSNWLVLLQWHSIADGSPPLAVAMNSGHVQLNRWNGPQDNTAVPLWTSAAPVQTGTWHTFVAHVKWSALPNTGFVEFWHNGVQVLTKTFLATEKCCAVQGTAVRPYPNYLKMGIYRDPTTVPTAILYHGPIRVGLDMSSVVPPSPGG